MESLLHAVDWDEVLFTILTEDCSLSCSFLSDFFSSSFDLLCCKVFVTCLVDSRT